MPGITNAARSGKRNTRPGGKPSKRRSNGSSSFRTNAISPKSQCGPCAAATATARNIEQRSDGTAGHRKLTETEDEIEALLIEVERQRINELLRTGKLTDETRRKMERELDLRVADLSNARGEG